MVRWWATGRDKAGALSYSAKGAQGVKGGVNPVVDEVVGALLDRFPQPFPGDLPKPRQLLLGFRPLAGAGLWRDLQKTVAAGSEGRPGRMARRRAGLSMASGYPWQELFGQVPKALRI
jgi:hypothetical protein